MDGGNTAAPVDRPLAAMGIVAAIPTICACLAEWAPRDLKALNPRLVVALGAAMLLGDSEVSAALQNLAVDEGAIPRAHGPDRPWRPL
jgi:hypothetical protein